MWRKAPRITKADPYVPTEAGPPKTPLRVRRLFKEVLDLDAGSTTTSSSENPPWLQEKWKEGEEAGGGGEDRLGLDSGDSGGGILDTLQQQSAKQPPDEPRLPVEPPPAPARTPADWKAPVITTLEEIWDEEALEKRRQWESLHRPNSPPQIQRVYRFLSPFTRTPKLPRRQLPALHPKSIEEMNLVKALNAAIRSATSTNEDIFHLYSQLETGAGYLDEKTLYQLVKRFMSVPQRNRTAMRHYLSILEDMRKLDLHILPAEWNQAISFVTRSYAATSRADVDLALSMWQERAAVGITDDDVDATTGFNILLDAASRASWDRLVYALLREMKRRGLEFNRFTYTTLITYYGNRRDVEGISAAYKSAVDAGEVIDTTVLNCIMSALIKAWKFPLAKRIFDWMLAHQTPAATAAPGTPPDSKLAPPTKELRFGPVLDWRQKRYNAQRLKRLKAYQTNFSVSLSPDMTTYHIILSHYCSFGYWDEVSRVLSLQSSAGIPWFKHTFVALLKGFHWHGGIGHEGENPWNRERLEEVMEMMFRKGEEELRRRQEAVREAEAGRGKEAEEGVQLRTGVVRRSRFRNTIDGVQGVDGEGWEWDKSAVIWMIKAVRTVHGDEEEVRRVWERLRQQIEAGGGQMWEVAERAYAKVLEDLARRTPIGRGFGGSGTR